MYQSCTAGSIGGAGLVCSLIRVMHRQTACQSICAPTSEICHSRGNPLASVTRRSMLQEEAERKVTSAEVPAGKFAQPGHQLSFDVIAHAGPPAARPAPVPRQERCQPVPATPEASAHMHSQAAAAPALLPIDVLFASWQRIVEPTTPHAAQHSSMAKRAAAPAQERATHRRLMSHRICCDSDCD